MAWEAAEDVTEETHRRPHGRPTEGPWLLALDQHSLYSHLGLKTADGKSFFLSSNFAFQFKIK